MKQLSNNTFSEVIRDAVEDRLEVEVGDIKQPEFFPQVKIKRWDNEVNFSVRLKGLSSGEAIQDNNVIKISDDKKEAHFYELPVSEVNPEGGFEFEVLLKEKPISNKIEFTIETKGLKFFYQPELIPQETEIEDFRPENVIGSYAVYHKTKKHYLLGSKNYKAGKAFHIYRPKIIDANGNWVWGELNIDEQKKLLTITIPQSFLDTGVYPILVDPTFGYTTAGASVAQTTTDLSLWSHDTAPENGTVTSISAYNTAGSFDDGPFAFGLYDFQGSSPNNYLANTDELVSPISGDWNTLSITAGDGSITNGSDYTFHQWGEEISLAFDTNGDDRWASGAMAYPASWPSTIDDPDFASGGVYSIYATYTAAGGGVVEIPLRTLLGVGL